MITPKDSKNTLLQLIVQNQIQPRDVEVDDNVTTKTIPEIYDRCVDYISQKIKDLRNDDWSFSSSEFKINYGFKDFVVYLENSICEIKIVKKKGTDPLLTTRKAFQFFIEFLIEQSKFQYVGQSSLEKKSTKTPVPMSLLFSKIISDLDTNHGPRLRINSGNELQITNKTGTIYFRVNIITDPCDPLGLNISFIRAAETLFKKMDIRNHNQPEILLETQPEVPIEKAETLSSTSPTKNIVPKLPEIFVEKLPSKRASVLGPKPKRPVVSAAKPLITTLKKITVVKSDNNNPHHSDLKKTSENDSQKNKEVVSKKIASVIKTQQPLKNEEWQEVDKVPRKIKKRLNELHGHKITHVEHIYKPIDEKKIETTKDEEEIFVDIEIDLPKSKIKKKKKPKDDDYKYINKALKEKNILLAKQRQIDFQEKNKGIIFGKVIGSKGFDDKEFFERLESAFEACLKSEDWEGEFVGAFAFLRSLDISTNKYIIVYQHIKNYIENFKDKKITSNQICSLVYHFTFLLPSSHQLEENEYFVSPHMATFKIFILSVEKLHFKKQLELLYVLSQYYQGVNIRCYEGVEIEIMMASEEIGDFKNFEKLILNSDLRTKKLNSFILDLIMTNYNKKISVISIKEAVDILLNLPHAVKKDLSFSLIFNEFARVMKACNVDPSIKIRLFSKFNKLYESLAKEKYYKKEVFHIFYEQILSFVYNYKFSLETCEDDRTIVSLFTDLIEDIEVYYPKQGGESQFYSQGKESFEDKIITGVRLFSAFDQLDIDTISLDSAKIALRYLWIPMEDSHFRKCFQIYLDACQQHPKYLECDENKIPVTFLHEGFSWITNLLNEFQEWECMPLEIYGELLKTCNRVMFNKEIQNTPLGKSYDDLYTEIQKYFLAEVDKELHRNLKGSLSAFKNNKNDKKKLPFVFAEAIKSDVQIITNWLCEYQNLFISSRVFLALRKEIQDEGKFQIAIAYWIKFLREDKDMKLVFLKEDIEGHISNNLKNIKI